MARGNTHHSGGKADLYSHALFTKRSTSCQSTSTERITGYGQRLLYRHKLYVTQWVLARFLAFNIREKERLIVDPYQLNRLYAMKIFSAPISSFSIVRLWLQLRNYSINFSIRIVALINLQIPIETVFLIMLPNKFIID